MVPNEIGYRVDPGDVPPEKAARRLHLTPDRFQDLLPRLIERGFPAPDPDTGYYDLEAIDVWRKLRHSHLFGLTSQAQARQPESEQKRSMGERFRETKERKRHG
jgi:hypothetical protein